MKKNSLKIKFSLVINTKNEEQRLRRCIDSAKNIVDEIIVVDMHSTDKTINIAKKLGARIFSVPDYGFADPARNFALDKATNQWILTLDADEVITKDLQEIIIKIIKEDKYDVVKFPFKSILYGKWMKHTGWWPDYHERLFKKGYVKYYPTVHTAPKIKGRVLVLDAIEKNAIIHYTTETVSGSVFKIDKYTSLENHFDLKRKISPQEVIDYYESEFRDRFFNAQGYLDGIQGFIFSKYMEFYRFIIFAKFWEKNHFPELFSGEQIKKTLEENYNNSPKKLKVRDLQNRIFQLESALDQIKSSKFYKLWRKYCIIRSTTKDLIKSFLK